MTIAPTGSVLRFNTWSELHLALFYIYRGRVEPRYHVYAFQDWPPCTWLVLRGQVRLEFGSGSAREIEEASAGQWIFLRSQKGRQIFSNDAEVISIRASIAWPTGNQLFDLPQSRVMESGRIPELQLRAEDLLAVVHQRLGNPGMDLHNVNESLETHFSIMSAFHRWSEAYVRSLLAMGVPTRTPAEVDPRIKSALFWLDERPLTMPWTEPELASYASLSVSQLCRLFLRHCGATPLEYYERRRLRSACQLLFTPGEDIKSIAYQLGFKTPGNFSTWFRKRMHNTPTEWRRSRDGGEDAANGAAG